MESGSRATGGLWIAVGMGVNLARKPIDSERPATALTTYRAAPPPSPVEAVEVLADAFERWSRVWTTLGFPAIADAWTARAHGLGEPCVARLGNETVEGVAEGLDGDGALKLRLPDGRLRRITAGDVFFGEAP